MLPLIAAGASLAGSVMANKQAEEDARKRALEGLSDAYASGSYMAPPAPSDGADTTNMLAGAGLAALNQADKNKALAAKGDEATFGDDLAQGLRLFYRG